MKKVIKNISQLITPDSSDFAAGKKSGKLTIYENASIVIKHGKIARIITDNSLIPLDAEIIDAKGAVVMPAFVDSHTHIPFAGTRPEEFNKRIQGHSYMDIAAAGGGIKSTVENTREMSEDELFEVSLKHLAMLIKHGIATVEMKSGYGLDTETELKQLRVIDRLKKSSIVDIRATFMGAHDIPLEYKENKNAYIDLLINEMLPIVKEQGIADYCDIFCEKDVFEIEDSRKILLAARKLGFELRMHADEIVPLGGGELAGEVGAVSADHLVHISENGIKKMIKAGTVFTMLPGTTFFLMSDKYAPAKKIIEEGGIVALSTDFNPGSSFTYSMPLIISIACLKMGITIEQAICAATINGAYALGLSDETGSVHKGKQADLIFMDAPDYRYLVYNFGVNRITGVMKKGEMIYQSST